MQTVVEDLRRIILEASFQARITRWKSKGRRVRHCCVHGSACRVTDLKSTLNDHPLFNAAAKIDFVLGLFTGAKINRKRLLRFQRRNKLGYAYVRKLAIFAPRRQGLRDLIENHYAWHNGCVGEMPG